MSEPDIVIPTVEGSLTGVAPLPIHGREQAARVIDRLLGRVDALTEDHWLIFRDDRVVGCHCGFEADADADCGYGDSVVRHLLEVGFKAGRESAAATREDTDDEPLIDPDCRGGKHASCVGGLCECDCHREDA